MLCTQAGCFTSHGSHDVAVTWNIVFVDVTDPSLLISLRFCNFVVETMDDDADFNVPVDIFAIGFEEIVDLNAGNIVSARFAVR